MGAWLGFETSAIGAAPQPRQPEPSPCALLVSSQPRRKLSPEAPARARELAALGLPLASIAAALGVHRATLHRWRTETGAEGLERDLCDAIERGRQEGEAALVRQLHKAAADGDARTAQWLLTHAPDWRQAWSDAAAERRAVEAYAARFLEVLMASPDLTADGRYRLLLALEAAGAAPLPADGDDDRQEGRRLLREWLAEPEG